MNDYDKDSIRFSLEGDDDYDSVEEEFIEHDEEDPDAVDEEYDDEDYGDEEEYADDEGYDDEYADDEGAEEETADAGYNDEYYDDRLNKALEEIAEIKRGMSPSVYNGGQQQPPPAQPQYIYPPQPAANSEVLMYNEISRLRDELSKTQNSQSMHVELERMRSEMERDKKISESQYMAEIRRLNEKIEDLLKNASSPLSNEIGSFANDQQLLSEGGKPQSDSSVNLSKLIAINEAVLRTTQDSGAKFQAELSAIKKTMDAFDSAEIAKNLKKGSKGAGEETVNQLNKLNTEIHSLHRAFSEQSGAINAPAQVNADLSGLLKHIFELKGIVGNANEAKATSNADMISFYDSLARIKYELSDDTVSYHNKLVSVFGLADKINDYISTHQNVDTDIISVILPLNEQIRQLSMYKLDRKNYDDLLAYSGVSNNIDISIKQRDQIERYLRVLDRCESSTPDNYMGLIPEIIAEKNTVQNNLYQIENESASSKFMEYMLSDAANDARMTEGFSELAKVTINQVLRFPMVIVPPESTEPEAKEASRSLLDELVDIRTLLEATITDRSAEQPVAETITDAQTAEVNEPTNSESTQQTELISNIIIQIDDIRALIEDRLKADDFATSIDELRNQYLEISQRLVELTERNVAASTESAASTASTENTSNAPDYMPIVLDNLDYIRQKLDEQANVIAQDEDPVTEQAEEEDPLSYKLDDLLIKLDDLIVNQITQIDDNSRMAVDMLTPISGDIAEVKAQVQNVIDVVGANSGAADIAEVKAQVQNVLDVISADTTATDLQQIQANLQTLQETLTALSEGAPEFKDDLLAVSTAVNDLRELIAENANTENTVTAAIRDDITAIKDTVNAVNDLCVLINENAANDNNNINLIHDDIVAVRDNINAIYDAVSSNIAMADSIADLRDIVTNSMQESATDRSIIKDDVNATRAIVETLSESDQVNADTLAALMEDVAAVLEKVQVFEQTALDNKDAILAELNSIKDDAHNKELANEMAAAGISDEVKDSLLKEITSIRERLDVMESSVPTNADDTIAPQLQSFDDKLNAISALIAGQSTSNGEYDLVAEILSLREDIKAARIVDQNDISSELEAVKNELAALSSNSLLDEVRMMRDDVAALRDGNVSYGNIETSNEPTNDEMNLVLNEIVSLRDEVLSFKDEVVAAHIAEPAVENASVDTDNKESINTVLDELTAIHVEQQELAGNVDELKDIISRRTTIAPENPDAVPTASSELNVVLSEIINVKDHVEELNKSSTRFDDVSNRLEDVKSKLDSINASNSANTEITDRINELAGQIMLLQDSFNVLREETSARSKSESEQLTQEIASMRTALNDVLTLSLQPVQAAEGGDTSYAALIEEIRAMRDEIAEVKMAAASAATAAPIALDSQTIDALREELAQVRAESFAPVTAAVDADSIRAIVTQVLQDAHINETINALRNDVSKVADIAPSKDETLDDLGIFEDLTTIKTDVRTLKDVPDLGVMSEILALRDEFQALREEIEAVKTAANKTDTQATDAIAASVRALNSKLDNVTDSVAEIMNTTQKIEVAPDEKVLAQIQSLRDQLFAISMANVSDTQSGTTTYESYNNLIMDELASLRSQVATDTSGEISALVGDLTELKTILSNHSHELSVLNAKVEALEPIVSTGSEVAAHLDELKTELASQREADLTTLNFMSEIARVVERQNKYLNQVAESDITTQLADLKSEIASTDKLAQEITQIRQMLENNPQDIKSILDQINDLKGGLTGKAGDEQIMNEIAKLKDEVSAVVGNTDDDDLNKSISDLKSSLSQIAGLVSTPAPKANSTAMTAEEKAEAQRISEIIVNYLNDDKLIEQLIEAKVPSETLKAVVNDKLDDAIESLGFGKTPDKILKSVARSVRSKFNSKLK